jgi:hypothetical protein
MNKILMRAFIIVLFVFCSIASFTSFYPEFWLAALVTNGVVYLDEFGG